MNNTFYQAIMFGIVVVLIGLLLSILFSFLKPKLSQDCDKWDEYYVMEISLFTTGFVLRYLLENKMVGRYLYSN